MSNNLMVFENKQVEVFEWNGQVLFNPYHCGNCLDLSESSVRNHLSKMNSKQAVLLKNSDVRDKDIRNLNNAGEKFLTESGVYKLIFKSKKAEAERFQDWVTDEVLPQIRKTGRYIPINEDDSEKDILAKAVLIANKTIEQKDAKIIELSSKNDELEEKIEDDKHKVSFAEAVENSDDVILVKEMATILTQNGFEIGQNQLYEYLRKYQYLCSKKGGMYNLPTKKHEKLFKVTKRTIQHTQGTEVKNTPKITGKGQLYFIKKFAEYKMQGLTIKDLLSKKKEAM